MKKTILETKIELYRLLIKSNPDKMSVNDIDLMYKLSKDEEIQKLLES